MLDDEHVKAIGKAHHKSAAQVLIRYQIQRGGIAIPKSVHQSRLKENINVFDWKLTDKDMKTLNHL